MDERRRGASRCSPATTSRTACRPWLLRPATAGERGSAGRPGARRTASTASATTTTGSTASGCSSGRSTRCWRRASPTSLRLCWANEPWSRRWDGRDDDVLQPQPYSPKTMSRTSGGCSPRSRDRRAHHESRASRSSSSTGRATCPIRRGPSTPGGERSSAPGCRASTWSRSRPAWDVGWDATEVGFDAKVLFQPAVGWLLSHVEQDVADAPEILQVYDYESAWPALVDTRSRSPTGATRRSSRAGTTPRGRATRGRPPRLDARRLRRVARGGGRAGRAAAADSASSSSTPGTSGPRAPPRARPRDGSPLPRCDHASALHGAGGHGARTGPDQPEVAAGAGAVTLMPQSEGRVMTVQQTTGDLLDHRHRTRRARIRCS